MYLTIPDYTVVSGMLLIPLGIGLFYAWRDSKNVSREEYLLAGRQMRMVPVALSIFVTFQSAIALIGIPGEVHLYGSMIFGFFIGIGLSYIIGCYVMAPLLYPLQMTSIFEYLEMRYQSRHVRLLSTCIGMLQTFFYMIIALLAPGLSVQAAAGIPFWLSLVVVGSIGTLYTAIGGLKSVIWTDVFQTLLVFVGMVILMARGTVVVGGVKKVWEIAQGGERTSMMEFNLDPRVRHTWWGMIFGATFLWLTNVYNQSTLQRISSMKTKESAMLSLLINVPCNLVFGLILVIQGILIYSYFYAIRCDPLKGGIISNPNQIILVFVLHVLEDYPGLSGLYMSTIFSGALSTLSSGINSLAANTVEDILSTFLRGISERNVTILAKVFVCIYGIFIVGFAYLSRTLTGPVTQMAASVFGACGSAILGMFLVACTVPWANKYGALAGGIISLIVNISIVVGHLLYGSQPPILPSLPTDHCSFLLNQHWTLNRTAPWESTPNITIPKGIVSETSFENHHPHYGFFLFEVSYLWYSFIGTFVCSVVILIVSKLTGGHGKTETDAKLMLPILRKFWQLEMIPDSPEDEG